VGARGRWGWEGGGGEEMRRVWMGRGRAGMLLFVHRGEGGEGRDVEKWEWVDTGVGNRGVCGGATTGNIRLTANLRTFRRPACGAGL
jgi:hypothetical protein